MKSDGYVIISRFFDVSVSLIPVCVALNRFAFCFCMSFALILACRWTTTICVSGAVFSFCDLQYAVKSLFEMTNPKVFSSKDNT